MEDAIKYVIRVEIMLSVLVMKNSNYQLIKLPVLKVRYFVEKCIRVT